MAFNSFLKHTPFYNISSKRYHTAAKSTTSFFDSTFNHIRQNNQVQNTPIINFESVFSQGAKRRDHPLHSLSVGSNYIIYDNQNQQQNLDDTEKTDVSEKPNNEYVLKNPINIVLPFDQEHIILSIYKNRNEKTLNLTPGVDVSQAIKSTNSKKLPSSKYTKVHTLGRNKQQQQQRNYLHTATTTVPQQQISHDISLPKEGEPKFFQAIYEDSPVSPTDETMKVEISRQIEQAYKAGNYQRINSLYMSLKRNDIAPSLEVFQLVLLSVVKRNIDISLDEQNFQLMTIYQDVLSNKIKPDLEMYSLVLKQLLSSSINVTIKPSLSSNGEDFFKIAIDIFNASNTSSFQKFNSEILDLILIGMNIYPGLISQDALVDLFNNQTFIKTPIYFMSMITYSKHTQNLQLSLSLYEEFKTLTVSNPTLQEHQFEIYSCLISTLLHLKETQQATKFLDKLLGSIKSHPDYESKISSLLNSYLIPLSVSNPEKAFEIWTKFNKIDWIPEFSSAFYEHMLANSLSNYQVASFYYNYLITLPVCSSPTKFESLLISPFSNEGFRNAVITNFTALSIQQGDRSQLLKIIKHSMITGICFSKFEIYKDINSIFANKDLMASIINNHGLNQTNPFAFLTYLLSHDLITDPNEFISGLFCKKLIDEFGILKEGEPFNYVSFYAVIQKVFHLKAQTTTESLSDVDLANILSPLFIEFYDLENYYYSLRSKETLEFKEELLKFFLSLDIKLEEKLLSNDSRDAFKLLEGLQRQ